MAFGWILIEFNSRKDLLDVVVVVVVFVRSAWVGSRRIERGTSWTGDSEPFCRAGLITPYLSSEVSGAAPFTGSTDSTGFSGFSGDQQLDSMKAA